MGKRGTLARPENGGPQTGSPGAADGGGRVAVSEKAGRALCAADLRLRHRPAGEGRRSDARVFSNAVLQVHSDLRLPGRRDPDPRLPPEDDRLSEKGLAAEAVPRGL